MSGERPLSGKSAKRRAKKKRPVRKVVVTNLPKPQEVLVRLMLAVVKVVEQVELPQFAGVNAILDIILIAFVNLMIIPTVSGILLVRYGELVTGFVFSAELATMALMGWCIVYTVRRSPRWPKR